MWTAPMEMDKADGPFDSNLHIFEPKLDGHRILIAGKSGETRLFTRDGRECTRQYPELWKIPIDGDCVLDGELVCIDPATGQASHDRVMERLSLNQSGRIHRAANAQPVQAIIFDILFYNGRDIRSLNLMKRKSILDRALSETAFYAKIPYEEDKGIGLYRKICEEQGEGICAKLKDSPYLSRKTSAWKAIERMQTVEVILYGYRKEGFGWLAMVEENGSHRQAGMITSVARPEQRRRLAELAHPLMIGEDGTFVYLQPRIRAKVNFHSWNRRGCLRSPVFLDFAG